MSRTISRDELTSDELTINELDAVNGGSRKVDAATPKLFEAACKGTHIPEVTLT